MSRRKEPLFKTVDHQSSVVSSHVRTINVYLIFTASGASALIYQVIWARWLGLVFGNTATSVSIVLASFMLGLALGSWLAGRWLHRISDPMLVYAYMELGIGSFAVCFPLFTLLADQLFTSVVSVSSPQFLSLAVRAVLAFVLLAVPTTLMGATLPLLTDFFRRDPRHTRSWKVGLLYAANTLGAAIGTLAAGFVLIELIGIRSTTLIAAGLNFAVAYIGLRYSRSTNLQPPGSGVSEDRSLGIAGKLTLGVLAASGAIALASEVLWTRVLETLIGNSTYSFGMILVVYLLGIASGSWTVSLIVNRLKSLPLWLAAVQMSMGLWTVISIALFGSVSDSISQYSRSTVSVSILLLNYSKASSLLFPLAFFSGATFPIATRILDPKREDAEGVLIARAYAWNTIGAVFGSLAAGFGIAVLFDYFQAVYVLVVLYGLTALTIVVAVMATTKKKIQKQYSAVLLCALTMAVTAFGAVQSTKSGRFMSNFNVLKEHMAEVIYHKPGLQGVTSVIRRQGDTKGSLLLVNGIGMTVKVTDTKMMAHLPMLLHPDPENTLVICFGMGTTYRSAVSHGRRVTVVELVDEVYDAFDYFYEDAGRVRAYSAGSMITNDGRNFLKLTEEYYDVITVDPPPPIDASGVNHLYSKEFIELARSRLKEGGIMAHWIPFPNRGGGVDDWTTFRMLADTFTAVFPDTVVLPGWNKIGLHLVGSREQSIEVSQDEINQRLSSEEVASDLREWDDVTIEYFQDLKFLPPSDENPLITTDDRPTLEFYLVRSWRHGTKKRHPASNW
jgi:spermidine synthase